MSRLRCILDEAAREFRFGLASGIPLLVFAGIAAYMLIVMSSAGYMQEMAAADIPRNAPSIVYMMTAGCAFFLFFAWAWIFAQPVLRDRRAMLHEVVLAAPVSLRAVLLGRYLGALGVASLLGAAQATGFLLAPLLELSGAVPPGSIGPTPWAAMAWGWLLLSLPTAAGAGAVYLALTLATRSLVGAFAGAAALLLCWMVAMALMDSSIDPAVTTMLDPSGYAHVDRTVRFWTPAERSSALYPLTTSIVTNRIVWGVLPLLALAVALALTTRERLVLDAAPRAARRTHRLRPGEEPTDGRNKREFAWLAALRAETGLQLRQALKNRALWICATLVALIGLAAMFVHVVGHADGPLVLSMEVALPILQQVLFLVVAFIVAAIAGHMMRRDDRPGFDEMIGTASAPVWVLLAGRTAAVFAVTTTLALAPALSVLAGALLAAPGEAGLATPLLFQLAVLLPALLEIAAIVMLIHAIIRPAGPAYAASILATFVLVVNHETALVTHPLFQAGIPATLSLSRLLGWQAWADKLLIVDGYKLAGSACAIGLAGFAMPSGRELTPTAVTTRLRGPIGGLTLLALTAAIAFGLALHQQVDLGGYRSRNARIAEDAMWEKRWLPRAAAFSVAGGQLDLDILPDESLLRASWRLQGVKSAKGELHAGLPDGFVLDHAEVDGRDVTSVVAEDHLAVPLGRCPETGCTVTLRWHVALRGWDADGVPPWLGPAGVWLAAERAAPKLGFDADRLLRAPSDRRAARLPLQVRFPPAAARQSAIGVAPAGAWTWRISVAGGPSGKGATNGPLDPLFAWAPAAARSRDSGLLIRHAADKALAVDQIAQDAAAMRRCVTRRTGRVVALREIVQVPRGLVAIRLRDGFLFLPENPYWDVDGVGNGRLHRRAQIAAAIAADLVAGSGKLRQGDGAQWLLAGLPGAIGLLCVGDSDGIDALVRLMARESEKASLAINQSDVQVGTIRDARMNGWVSRYAALASLGWVARQTPATLNRLLRQIETGATIGKVLSQDADLLLDQPFSSDIRSGLLTDSKSWRWSGGNWRASSPPDRVIALVRDRTGVVVIDTAFPNVSQDALLLDARPSLERTPLDNVQHGARVWDRQQQSQIE